MGYTFINSLNGSTICVPCAASCVIGNRCGSCSKNEALWSRCRGCTSLHIRPRALNLRQNTNITAMRSPGNESLSLEPRSFKMSLRDLPYKHGCMCLYMYAQTYVFLTHSLSRYAYKCRDLRIYAYKHLTLYMNVCKSISSCSVEIVFCRA